MRKHLAVSIAALVTTAFVAGCSSDGGTSPGGSRVDSESTTAASASGSIVVSAAASLTGAFTTIRDDFVAANPDARVTINFGSSGQLATQITEGAPADLAAFADTTPMDTLEDADLLAAPPQVFARNQLVIVTEPGNPEKIETLSDLADAGTISLCVATAPCGRFANQILGAAGVSIPADRINRGTDVRSTLTAVSEGDAVAGIVYVTDAESVADRVDTVDIAASDNVIASYPIAVVGATSSTELARAFEAYVLSDAGQAVLADAGFLAP